MRQVLAKLVLSVPLVWMLVYVWRSDIDLGRLMRPDRLLTSWFTKQTAWIPTKDADAVYQGEKVVGRVDGVTIDEAAGTITFKLIANSGPMAIGEPFVFRRYQLRPTKIGVLTGLSSAHPEKGQILEDVVCPIIGAA